MKNKNIINNKIEDDGLKKNISYSHLELKILKKITEDKLEPIPKWQFFIKESFIWLVYSLIVVFASLILSIFIYCVLDTNTDLLERAGIYTCGIGHFICCLFWLLFFIFIALSARFCFLKTNYSYRILFRATHITIATLVILASIFYYYNVHEFLEKIVINNVPHYSEYFRTKMTLWSQPDRGLLSGKITYISEDNICINPKNVYDVPHLSNKISIEISDFHNKKWNIKTDDTLLYFTGCISVGDEIRIFGKTHDSNTFDVKEIWRW